MDIKQLRRSPANTLAGTVDDLEEAYGRNVSVPWAVFIPVLLFAAIGILPIILVNRVRGRSSASFGDGRSLKDLRNGPEIAVIPLWIRDDDGGVRDIEILGYVRSDRVMLGDHVEVTLRRPLRRGHLMRAHVIKNHTTGQTIKPHPATSFWHLGIALILQAGIGFLFLAALVFLWYTGQ